jgi:hypothetical protein
MSHSQGDDSGGDEGERCGNLDRGGDIGKGIVARPGEGDADGVDATDEGLYGDSGVPCPVLDVSPAFLNRFSSVYLDPSLRWTLGTRGYSGSTSCPADRGLRPGEEEGTGRLS